VQLPLRELGEYLEAGLVKAKMAALFAGFVRTPGGSDPLNKDGLPSLEPGSLTRLPENEEVEFTEPPDAGAGFAWPCRREPWTVIQGASGGSLPRWQ
jgi:hypothetical protein